MPLINSDALRDEEPAVSWVLKDDEPPGLHFLPSFWAMVQTLAIMKQAPATDLVVNMLTDIIESCAVVEPAAAPRIALGWKLKEKVGDELDEAMLLFLEDTMPTIAGLWEKSIDDTQDGIAEGLIQSVCREHGPVGHA